MQIIFMKKGQRVLVWSLQSFKGGGFLNGEPAFARQTENGDSVILCVIRNINGRSVIDESYEVYIQQTKEVCKECWPAKKELKAFRKKVMQESSIT